MKSGPMLWLLLPALSLVVTKPTWAAEAAVASEEAELEALRKAAEEMAGPVEAAPAEAEVAPETAPGPRFLPALNPEVSVIGDVVFSLNDTEAESQQQEGEEEHAHPEPPLFLFGRDKFTLRTLELSLQAPLDPFSLAKVFLHWGGEGHVHVCEAYIDYTNLGKGWRLKCGKFRPTLGVLNRWHEHALPQVDPPRVYSWLFSEGSLSGLGLEVSRLVGPFWADTNELALGVINGSDPFTLAGEDFDRPALTLHLKSYYDLNPSIYFEWGLSGLVGWNDPAGDNLTHLEVLDFTYDWTPVGRAKYRGLTVRGELFWCHRQQEHFIYEHLHPAGATPERYATSLSGYLYAEQTFQRNWQRGLRLDYVELPDRPQDREWGLSAYVTFWQSEFTRWRLQYSHLERNFAPNENVLFLQVDWGMGPHRHEAY